MTAKIGDVFVRSWGYDQTNVDFYELTALSKTGKTGRARHLRSVTVSDSGQSTRVTAATGPDRFTTDGRCARCSNHHRDEPGWDGHAYTDEYTYQANHDRVTVDGQHGDHAWRWDGEAEYQTGYGWGH
jgi:hypothetical protein